jgi:hypothetical protein
VSAMGEPQQSATRDEIAEAIAKAAGNNRDPAQYRHLAAAVEGFVDAARAEARAAALTDAGAEIEAVFAEWRVYGKSGEGEPTEGDLLAALAALLDNESQS